MEIQLILACPLLGAVLLALWGHRAFAAWINIAVSAAAFAGGCALAWRVAAHGTLHTPDGQFFADALNVWLVVLTTLVALCTAVYSMAYMRQELAHGRLTVQRLRLYHGMVQLFLFTLLLVLLTNNMGILWVATEAATLTTVLLVSLYRTPAALEAAWKYFILCGVGIAQALFGTILLYFAAERALGAGEGTLLWSRLHGIAGNLEPTVMSLAFVFFMVGYGTKAGLVPLHNWLPDAHAESPSPVSALLSGLLLNVALYALLRCKMLVDGALHAPFAGHLMMGFGLLSIVVAAFFLARQKDVKRLLAYSSIEHMGIATFAFGLGGAAASFAGMLHMTVHSLSKAAAFFAAGHAAQRAGTPMIENIRGLLIASPLTGWCLVLAGVAILGLPPSGLFASEFLVLGAAIREHPLTAPVVFIALAVAFAALFSRLQSMIFGETATPLSSMATSQLITQLSPAYLLLAAALTLGIYIPGPLAEWFRQAARLLG